jgi:hypothetical protein
MIVPPPAIESVPCEEVAYPAADDVVEAFDQPAGTTTETWPLTIPPVAAVYVKTIVLPLEP